MIEYLKKRIEHVMMLDICDANRLDLLSFKTIFPEAAFRMNHSKLQIYKNELFDIFSLNPLGLPG